MALENLFANEPSLPAMQKMKLPDDTRMWGEAITTLIKQKFPDLANINIEIEFRRKDEPTGSAIGAAHLISDEAQKTVCIPLIIKRFEMSPLDIWMEKESQAVHPIKTDTFKEQFFVPQAMEGLDTRPTDAAGQYFNDPSTWTSTYPPLQGRYSYASAGYSLLDLISDTLYTKDVGEFRTELTKHAYVLNKYFKHGHKEILQKIAAKQGVNRNDFVASARALIPISVAQVRKNGGDRYSVLAGANGLFNLSESLDMDRESCKRHLEKITAHAADILHEVDQEGEKMLIMPPAKKDGVFLYDDMKYSPEEAKEFGAYHVKMKGGHSLEGVVIPNVVNFAGKKQGMKLFIAPEHASMQGNVVGVLNKDSTIFTSVLKPHNVRVGQTGTFVFVDDGKAIATIPVTIKSIERHAEYPIKAYDLKGNKIRIKQSWSDSPVMAAPAGSKKDSKFLDVHGMIEVRADEYIIPNRMMWIPMENFQEVSASKAEWMDKEASVIGKSKSVLRMFDRNSFELETSGTKLAGDRSMTAYRMACLGANEAVIDQSFKKVAKAKKIEIFGLSKIGSTEELEKKASATSQNLDKICDNLRCSLIKEAAEVEDTESVDAMLALNFLNPDNLSKFVSYRPVFEKCADYLAQVTLASRLGLNDVNESATAGAMQKMLDVTEGLRRVETAMSGENINNNEPLPVKEQK